MTDRMQFRIHPSQVKKKERNIDKVHMYYVTWSTKRGYFENKQQFLLKALLDRT